jgi:hypothetical protein
MGIVLLIPNSGFEPLALQLDYWIKWLRPGTLSAKIGAIKGAIMPMTQGVYYDREAIIDEHAVWDTVGEGETVTVKRRIEEYRNDKGTKVAESVVMKDPRIFNKAMRAYLDTEQPVEVPFLIEEKWFTEQVAQLAKDQMGLAPVDFGALRYVREGYAKIRPNDP